MPFFKPCNCATTLGEFAVYSGSSPGISPVSRMKYGFDSQIVQMGAVSGPAGTAQQAARSSVKSYLVALGGGGNGNCEIYTRATDTAVTVPDAWGVITSFNATNSAGPLDVTQSSFFFRNDGSLTFFAYEVTWASDTFNSLGGFLAGTTVGGRSSGAVYSNDQAHIAGNGANGNNQRWLYDRQLNAFNINGTIIQAGNGFCSISGPTRGYYFGGVDATGTTPLNTVIRFVYDTQASVATTNLPCARGQVYAAYNNARSVGVMFAGGLLSPATAQAQSETIRFLVPTESTSFSSVLVQQATNTAGA